MTSRKKDQAETRAAPLQSEQPFPSPTWEWRYTMIRRPAGGHTRTAAAGLRWRGLPRRNPRDPLTCTVKLRGGAEAWVEIHARGDSTRVPGNTTIAELVLWMNGIR